ncbi:ATP-binding cassette domain-containing protein [Micromonospora sp. STR1s_6]|uniref:ATP-binding cassette domain-containing protein n=2 Tax=Micromonospora tarensis TaxID=2806100 RepID=A0ABS1YAJ6_9ACTN|nr:ATP-binding cassette domain-containing protein [Micromonospora tarensis]
MIEALDVGKRFGKVTALDSVSLEVPRGSVLGLLGHNGAGKTTLVNILATMITPSSGTARVAGYDVVSDGSKVRQRIGLTGQFASVDEDLTGMANLVLIARLLGAGRQQARERADELLAAFDLSDAATRPVQGYSGGMRRRLDLAASLVGQPEVVFLDEPTTGLDPVSRNAMWAVVQRLVGDGTTILLTTQYLEEADRLADSIVVLSHGRVVAAGTSAAMKAGLGRRTVTARLRTNLEALDARTVLERGGLAPALDESRDSLIVPVQGFQDLSTIVRLLGEARIEPAEVALTEATLDDVYLALAADEHKVSV